MTEGVWPPAPPPPVTTGAAWRHDGAAVAESASVTGDVVWFPWPATVTALLTLTTCHLYGTASRNDRPSGTRAALALACLAALALPVVPLALSVKAGCTDTGGGVELSSFWLLAAVVGAISSSAVLGWLYAKGGAVGWLPAAIIPAAVLAAVVEYGISLLTLAVYCEDDSLAVLYGQVLAGGIASVIGGWLLIRRAG